MQLLTLVVESRLQQGCPDWASEGAEAFVAAEVVLLGHPGLEQQVVAAGWWVLQDDLVGQVPSVAVTPPVTVAWGAVQVSVVVFAHQVISGQQPPQRVSVAVIQTVASELEGTLPGFAEEHPDLAPLAGQRTLGYP